MPELTLEFVSENAATVWQDGQPLTTGHGAGREAALLDAWTSLVDQGHTEAAEWVARKYRALTGRDPERPRR